MNTHPPDDPASKSADDDRSPGSRSRAPSRSPCTRRTPRGSARRRPGLFLMGGDWMVVDGGDGDGGRQRREWWCVWWGVWWMVGRGWLGFQWFAVAHHATPSPCPQPRQSARAPARSSSAPSAAAPRRRRRSDLTGRRRAKSRCRSRRAGAAGRSSAVFVLLLCCCVGVVVWLCWCRRIVVLACCVIGRAAQREAAGGAEELGGRLTSKLATPLQRRFCMGGAGERGWVSAGVWLVSRMERRERASKKDSGKARVLSGRGRGAEGLPDRSGRRPSGPPPSALSNKDKNGP